jgi:TusE/DsrC/DsvC family sulfur relay protein
MTSNSDLQIQTDSEGFLVNLDEWSEDVANGLARRDNCELSDAHWQVINWIRAYFADNGVAPNLRVMLKLIGVDLGEAYANKTFLFDLFPYGPAKQGARYAGMPKPTGCV